MRPEYADGVGSILDQGGELTTRSILTPQVIAGLVGLIPLSLAAAPIKKNFAARDQQVIYLHDRQDGI